MVAGTLCAVTTGHQPEKLKTLSKFDVLVSKITVAVI
jgi:hypothetical protein